MRVVRRAKRSEDHSGAGRPRHAYLCPICGWWHMTSQRKHSGGNDGGLGKCRACPAEILWARMPSGRANPLDVETVEPEERKGVTAYDPRDGSGMPVTIANVDELRARAETEPLSFHTSHFATCPARQKFKRNQVKS